MELVELGDQAGALPHHGRPLVERGKARVGPQRRDYVLTDAGFAALHEWAAVMRERTRLIAEFAELHGIVHLPWREDAK